MNDKSQIESYKAIFNDNLPFRPQGRQFLYVEPNGYDENINRYFHEHYDEITERFGEYQFFSYLPAIVEQADAILKYNFPNVDVDNLLRRDIPIQTMYNDILSCCTTQNLFTQQPMLMRYEWGVPEGYYFTLFPLHYESEEQFKALVEAVRCAPVPDSGLRASSIREFHGTPQDWADWNYIDTLAGEIRQRVEQLRMMGVTDYAIRQMIALPEPKLSRMVITKNYRILLPDYNNMEITMPTLSKVVYFFFLRHPEGVMFKQLVDYREELLQLYYRLSNREDITKLERSIDELVDSTHNSINEKCSRIRAAFVSQFCPELAYKYYITGERSNLKIILLARNMIFDESGTITSNK